MIHSTLAVCIITFTSFGVAASWPRLDEGRNGVAIPITKHTRLVNADNFLDHDAFSSHIASIEAKIKRGFENYETNLGKKHPYDTRDVASRGNTLWLNKYLSYYWYGAIFVGTPPELFLVVLDTGSSDLFIPTVSCEPCKGHKLWNPSSSTTSLNLTKEFYISYEDGSSVSGYIFTDDVYIAGLTATTQTLGASILYSDGFRRSEFVPDGMMGMGFQPISRYDANPVFQTLVSQGKVVDSTFSFMLSEYGGELCIGGSNSQRYTGDFTFIPVTVVGFWQVTMDNIQANGRAILDSIAAIIDTGTPHIAGNPSEVSALYDVLGGKPIPGREGQYSFPCDSLPTVTLTFGGKPFPIPPSSLNMGKIAPDSSDCLSGIAGQHISDELWIVGGVFLQTVYTTFDVRNQRVGFAMLSED